MIRQMTARVDLNPFSVAPSPLRRECFFTARDEVLKIQQESLEETSLARFRGARVGNCSVDARGEKAAVSVRWPDKEALAVISADGSGHDIILEKPHVAHPQFCPGDATVLLYSQGKGKRLFLIGADGSEDRLLFEAPDGEHVVHESWLGRTGEIMFVLAGGRLAVISKAGGTPRTALNEGVWHPVSNREGAEIVCDTRNPDRGILLVDPQQGRCETLCSAEAKGLGRWWRDPGVAVEEDVEAATLRSDTPEAERAPTQSVDETAYGPEWTHPHPMFSPDGKRVVFTGDRLGWPQVFVLERSQGSDSR